MPRDTHYRYHTIAIKRGSLLEQQLLCDAKESSLGLPTLIRLRLGDYYKGENHSLIPAHSFSIREEAPSVISEFIDNIDAADSEWPD